MPSEWHENIKRLFEKVGNQLGFDSKAEFRIPKGYIDCVWKLEKPVSEIFIAFEFETAIAGFVAKSLFFAVSEGCCIFWTYGFVAFLFCGLFDPVKIISKIVSRKARGMILNV